MKPQSHEGEGWEHQDLQQNFRGKGGLPDVRVSCRVSEEDADSLWLYKGEEKQQPLVDQEKTSLDETYYKRGKKGRYEAHRDD